VTEHCRTHSTSGEGTLADTLLETGWLLTAILVPLAINLWARQPFEPPKAAVLRSLVWVMAGIWIADCLVSGRSLLDNLRSNPLLWPALAVASAQVLATLLATDRGLAVWGSYERGQGLLTQVSYVLLFLIVSARLHGSAQARRLLSVMAFTALPMFVLGMAQALGWSPVHLVTDARSSVFATLGRSNFVGAYVALLLPLTLALMVTAQRRTQRLVWLGLTSIEILLVGLTLARGAWLAALAGTSAFGLLWFWPRLSRRWRMAIVAGGVATGLVILTGILWLDSRGGSVAARLTIWRAVLELIVQRPLLGFGPDTLGLVFPRVYPPQLVYYQGRGVAVDRAHNLFLDWAVSTGLLGLVAWTVLLVTFFVTGWRAMKQTCNSKQRALLTGCLAAVAANVIGNLVSFDLTATASATSLIMAVTVSLAAGPIRIPKQTLDRTDSRQLPRPLAVGGASLVLGAVIGAIVVFNLHPQVADVSARTADRRSANGAWASALHTQEQAVTLWPVEPEHRMNLSWAYLNRALAGWDTPQAWLARAETQLQTARDLRPGDSRIWAALGELYGLWGNRWDPSKLPIADGAYRQALLLAPNQATLYTGWGMVALQGEDYPQAAARFQQAVDLDATDAHAFMHLGDAELALGDVDAAQEAYRQAIHWQPELSHAHLGLARCYWQLGSVNAARAALEDALRLDPGNAAARALYEQIEAAP
jgi:putative inorganic carbon (HCO3(-)) transporter